MSILRRSSPGVSSLVWGSTSMRRDSWRLSEWAWGDVWISDTLQPPVDSGDILCYTVREFRRMDTLGLRFIEWVSLQRLKMYQVIDKWTFMTSKCALYWEVFPYFDWNASLSSVYSQWVCHIIEHKNWSGYIPHLAGVEVLLITRSTVLYSSYFRWACRLRLLPAKCPKLMLCCKT